MLRERWWIILLVAAICTAAGVARSTTSTKTYDATAKLLFSQDTLATEAGGAGPPPDVDPEGTKATNVLLVTTNQVADAVREQLGLTDRSAADLLDQMKVETESTAKIVDVTATDVDPQLAARIANVWVQQFAAIRRDQARAKVQQGEDLLRQRLSQTPATDREQLAGLNDGLSRLARLEALTTGDVDVIDRAQVPESPSSPKPIRDGAIALLLGIALGVGLAFLLNLLDRRVKTIEDLEATYGLPAVSSVPLRLREPRSQQDRDVALEPFRILSGALATVAGGREVRIILVTSAVPGEGKSTVASGLSRALASSGKSVALVEADLRRPSFHLQFDLGGDRRGLSTALVGGVPAAELLRAGPPASPGLTVLPSGPTPPNSAELLRSEEFSEVLRELLAAVDVVVLDAPPLLPVADSQVLLDNPLIDVGIIVGRAYHTKREEVRRCRAVIQRHHQRRLGLVVNGLRELDGGEYGYYGNADERSAQALR